MTNVKRSREKKYINLAAATDLQNDDKYYTVQKVCLGITQALSLSIGVIQDPVKYLMELFEKIVNDF